MSPYRDTLIYDNWLNIDEVNDLYVKMTVED